MPRILAMPIKLACVLDRMHYEDILSFSDYHFTVQDAQFKIRATKEKALEQAQDECKQVFEYCSDDPYGANYRRSGQRFLFVVGSERELLNVLEVLEVMGL
jgi:hypothetical protein